MREYSAGRKSFTWCNGESKSRVELKRERENVAEKDEVWDKLGVVRVGGGRYGPGAATAASEASPILPAGVFAFSVPDTRPSPAQPHSPATASPSPTPAIPATPPNRATPGLIKEQSPALAGRVAAS